MGGNAKRAICAGAAQEREGGRVSAERITKLTVRSIWPEKAAAPNGIPEFTTQDIALGVAHCNAIGGAILLHKYVFNHYTTQQCPEFYREVYDSVIQLAIRKGWDDGPKGERWYRRLAHGALYEMLAPRPCPVCKGAKFIGTRACHVCDATGSERLSVEDRREALEIPPAQWDHGKPPWKWRYEDVYRELSQLEGRAIAELARQLSDERHSG